jgi:hypothetical protein
MVYDCDPKARQQSLQWFLPCNDQNMPSAPYVSSHGQTINYPVLRHLGDAVHCSRKSENLMNGTVSITVHLPT